jgi:hypothetical protein
MGADATETGVNISYTDVNGVIRDTVVRKSDESTVISDFNVNEPLTYKTVYSPDSMAIDSFYAPEVVVRVIMNLGPVIEIPKNTWAEKILPGDIGVLSGSGTALRYIWSVNLTSGTNCYFSGELPLPQIFTWDLGVTVMMDRMKLYARAAFADDVWKRAHPKIFELYGSAVIPNSDGSLNGWKPLGRFECIKPSPWPTITAEDIAYAKAGMDFNFVADNDASFAAKPSAPVRFIRFRTIETFLPAAPPVASPVSIQEITFWGSMVTTTFSVE